MKADQKLWDQLLLEGWHLDLNCTRLLRAYIKDLAISPDLVIDWDEFHLSLLRVPSYLHQRIRVAVADEMNWLSVQLWAGKRSDEELIKMMTDANYDLERKGSDSKTMNFRQKVKKDEDATRQSVFSSMSWKKEINLSNQWKVTK